MFEKTKPSQSAFAPGLFPAGEAETSDSPSAFSWRDLAARINAARDLRLEMRRATDAPNSASLISERYERSINRDALEARKTSTAITAPSEGKVARGEKETTHD